MDVSLGAVRELAIYPVKGEPGRSLERAQVRVDGLVGDRRKKRPVHVVGLPDTPQQTRANVFLDVPDETLRAALGSRLTLGSVVLDLTEEPSGCPGLYAVVLGEGVVDVGAVARITD